ncbi:MAG: glycosyltransferase family 87 protein [Gemmataceae bacterium]
MPLSNLASKWRGLSFATKCAILVWCFAVVLPLTRAALAPHVNSVYVIFVQAARHWSAGQDLYQVSYEPFRYSPLVAVTFEPFSWLPDWLGGVSWRLLGAAIFLAALGWFCQGLLPASLSVNQRSVLFILASPLCVGNLNNGQSNLLMIGLLVAALSAGMKERWNLASFCVALAVLFKIYPVVVGLLLMLLYPRRFGFRFLGMLSAGLALPFLFQSPSYVLEQYAGWLRHLESNDRQLLPQGLWYIDMRLLFRLWIVPISYQGFFVVQAVTGLVIALVCWLAKKAFWPREKELILVLGLACCWMTAFGPASESATYVLLAPIASWLFLVSFQAQSPWWQRTLCFAGYGLLLASQLANWIPGGKIFQGWGPQPLAALLFLVGILAEFVVNLLSAQKCKWPDVRTACPPQIA